MSDTIPLGKAIKVGDKFGMLTVTAISGKTARTKCDCGRENTPYLHNLARGRSRSCGCVRITHHQTGSPTYNTWNAMLSRCCNPKSDSYPHYGGRGITVCERWSRFENFLSDMGVRPSEDSSIERKNNNLGYEPSNCVWASRIQQGRNQRSNRRLFFNGHNLTCSEWAERIGISPQTLFRRLKRWSLEKALTNPLDKTMARRRKASK